MRKLHRGDVMSDDDNITIHVVHCHTCDYSWFTEIHRDAESVTCIRCHAWIRVEWTGGDDVR